MASQPEPWSAAGRLGDGDPGCIRLCSRSHSGSLHRHWEAHGGHGLHAGSCQPLPHVSQRPLHARPGGGAPRERGRGPAVVRGGLVHQPHPREEHAAAGESGGTPPRQRQLWTLSPCAGFRCTCRPGAPGAPSPRWSVQVELPGAGSTQAVYGPPGRLGRLRAESGSEASGQPAKLPCGSGLSELVLVALGAAIVLLVSALLGAAPLGVPTPRGACRTRLRALYSFWGPLEPRPQPVPKATGWQGHPVRGGGTASLHCEDPGKSPQPPVK